MKGSEVVGSFADVSYVEFAPDGTLAFRASDGGKQFIVLGSERQPPFDGAFVYTAQNGGDFFVVTSRGRSSRYDGVLWDPQINDDGTQTAYAAPKGTELWWKVDSLK